MTIADVIEGLTPFAPLIVLSLTVAIALEIVQWVVRQFWRDDDV